MLKTALEKIARLGRGTGGGTASSLQREKIAHLREHGYVMFDHLVGTQRLRQLQSDYRKRVEIDLDFEFPVLAQKKIDATRDADLIATNFLATPEALAKRGLTFSREDVKSYDQAIANFGPSTLTTEIPDSIDWLDVWLDEAILPVVEGYMGFVPEMVEAFVRRNFPARFSVMNHAWHRDANHANHLLKGFIFLSDCTDSTGPHNYIAGSIQDCRLSGKKYYSDAEVRAIYPPESGREIISVVPAGTIILEDTRGLHKAGIPKEGFRDLGFSTFVPPIAFVPRSPQYKISRQTLSGLTPSQRKYIPAGNVIQ